LAFRIQLWMLRTKLWSSKVELLAAKVQFRLTKVGLLAAKVQFRQAKVENIIDIIQNKTLYVYVCCHFLRRSPFGKSMVRNDKPLLTPWG